MKILANNRKWGATPENKPSAVFFGVALFSGYGSLER